MRLLNFYTPGYRNLRNLPIIFTLHPDQQPDEACSIRFLVGPNGSGKTNLLYFLTAIFAALSEGYPQVRRPGDPAYIAPFHLVYQVGGHTITIASQGQGRSGLTFTVKSESGPEEKYEKGDIPSRDLILPQSFLIYTSGATEPWAQLLKADREPEPSPLIFTEIRPDEEEPLGPPGSAPDYAEDRELPEDDSPTSEQERIILVEPDHLPLALLTAFIHHEIQAEQDQRKDDLDQSEGSLLEVHFSHVLQQVQVDQLIGFSFCLTSDATSREPYERQIDRLKRQATLILDQWGDQWDEQLLIFDMDDVRQGKRLPIRLLTELAGEAQEALGPISPFAFFRQLVNLQQAGILRKLNLVVNQRDPRGSEYPHRTLLVENLSDGERAFLQRMALIHLLNEGERLFLFDEPGIHLNDTWKRNLVDHIERTLCHTNSEVILTTHSSVILTDAYPYEVILLGFHGQQNVPLTLAADPGEILRTVYGAQFSVGERSIRKIKDAIKEFEETDDDSKLCDLLSQVGPGYHRFKLVEVMSSRVSPDQET